jgi:hypothetical protein
MKDEQDDSKDNHQQQRGKEWEFSHKGLLRGATKKMGKVVLHPTYLYRRSPQDETNREHVKCPHCARLAGSDSGQCPKIVGVRPNGGRQRHSSR